MYEVVTFLLLFYLNGQMTIVDCKQLVVNILTCPQFPFKIAAYEMTRLMASIGGTLNIRIS